MNARPRATALCLCPDAAYFRPAVATAASLIAAGDSQAFDICIVCEPGDVAPGFERLAPELQQRIGLHLVDFAPWVGALQGRDRFPPTVYRRLFLDSVMPERYERLVYLDSDIWIARAGLSRLASFDLDGKPFAAAYDMIYLMDYRADALARRFQAYRRGLGLDLATPYFNSGLMAIDRAEWRKRDLTARAVAVLLAEPERFDYPEQSALNHLISGDFAPLSPRYNFMGDFFLLDLETTLEPIVLHFVNAPKPWRYPQWRGEARFARAYQAAFAASPWPEWAGPATLERARPDKPRLTPARRRFAERLTAFLSSQPFLDVV